MLFGLCSKTFWLIISVSLSSLVFIFQKLSWPQQRVWIFLAIATTLYNCIITCTFWISLKHSSTENNTLIFFPFLCFHSAFWFFRTGPHIRTFKMPTKNLRQIFQNQRETQYYRLVIGIRCLCTTLASLIWSDLDFNGGRIDVDEFGSWRESVEDFSEMILL